MKLANYKLILCFIVLITMFGCKKETIPYFTGNDSANFWVHSFNFSLYGATTTQLPQDTAILDIALSGKLADHDRTVMAVAVPDPAGTADTNRLTTATPDQYQILGGVIKANQQYGKFKIVVKNPSILATQDLLLKVKMTQTTDFVPGLAENNYVNIRWSRKFLQPATWKAMRFFFCATYSTQVYRIFMEVTGLKEFYYYEGLVTQQEGEVMGRNFGNRVRALSAQQGSPLLHDDGPNAGLPIIPIY